MKYYILKIENNKDGSNKKSVYEADSKNEAEKTFHSSFVSAINSESTLSCLVKVMLSNGTEIMGKYWQRTNEPKSTDVTE